MKKIILFILLGIMGFFLFVNFNEDKEKKMKLEVNEYQKHLRNMFLKKKEYYL